MFAGRGQLVSRDHSSGNSEMTSDDISGWQNNSERVLSAYFFIQLPEFRPGGRQIRHRLVADGHRDTPVSPALRAGDTGVCLRC